MKFNLFILLFFSAALGFSQSDDITVTTASFSEVKVYDGLSVTIKKGPINELKITGEDPKNVVILNEKGVLKIRMKFKKMFSGYRTFVTLSHSSSYVLLDANEESSIEVLYAISQPILEIKTQEGAQITADLKLEQLIVKAVSGGLVSTRGSAKIQDVSINTGGIYQGQNLMSSFTTIDVNAGGKASINAKDYVGATVKAGGSIKVFGDPKKMDEKTFFGGVIARVNN